MAVYLSRNNNTDEWRKSNLTSSASFCLKAMQKTYEV